MKIGKIISKGPIGNKAEVLIDGKPLSMVKAIDISIRPNELNKAVVESYVTDVNIEANILMSEDNLFVAAKYYGYTLVKNG